MNSQGCSAVDDPARVPDGLATIDAWRAQGAHRLDPVRFHLMEALARRSAAHAGTVRSLLEEKLQKLVQRYERDLQAARLDEQPASRDAVEPQKGRAPHRGVLGELADELDRRALPQEGGRSAASAASSLASSGELRAVTSFRSTWSRLSAERRLAQSLQHVPDNAGPLHSHHLIHRSLTLMRDVSPQYLDRFMSYVDSLLELDTLHGRGEMPAKEAARIHRSKKPGSDNAR